ncbi:hypothetical protein JZ751_020263 [Albula glossodonta]|uniref:Uncharacterized protein n=1 Tax=Albula glossodonta TaxID=121402 RepID=A0A8T2MV73_9TELE|nr:hypothetical protein JZ751_020263 [Albula glossodonta]
MIGYFVVARGASKVTRRDTADETLCEMVRLFLHLVLKLMEKKPTSKSLGNRTAPLSSSLGGHWLGQQCMTHTLGNKGQDPDSNLERFRNQLHYHPTSGFYVRSADAEALAAARNAPCPVGMSSMSALMHCDTCSRGKRTRRPLPK